MFEVIFEEDTRSLKSMLGLKEWQQLEKFKSRLIGVFEGDVLWE
jgi:hypothetical protein